MKADVKFCLAKRLKELREEKKISQKALASTLSISASTVACWEIETREPSLQALVDLSEYFGVTIDYLLGNSDERQVNRAEPPAREEFTQFEKKLLAVYRVAPISEQVVICRAMGLVHPSSAMAQIKKEVS